MVAYSLFSGSSGNCLYVEEGGTKFLIDAGCSMRRIEQSLKQIGSSLSEINGLWITHEHSDHTKALTMICKTYSIPVYCQNEVAKSLYYSALSENALYGAALAKCIRTVSTGEEYELGDILVSPFRTPHDSVHCQGFVLGEGKLGIATDIGHVTSEVRRYLSGCENIVLESNYDWEMLQNGRYPLYLKERIASENGHLSNVDCAAFSAELFVQTYFVKSQPSSAIFAIFAHFTISPIRTLNSIDSS